MQHSDGLHKYTSYRVDVRTSNTAVLRRYSDFLWVYEKLHQERPGSIVPPLPDKQPVGRFSPAFVEERRLQLERFLRRTATHPELADAPSLHVFLTSDDVTFQAAKQTKAVATANTGSSMMMESTAYGMPTQSPKKDGLKRWFAEAKTSMTGDLVRSPDDDLFEEIQRYITQLDNQMRNVAHQASGLVRKGKEIANGLFEFGLAFSLLGQSEADALGQALSQVGGTADQLSVLAAEHATHEMTQFEEPLQDYLRLVHACKLALARRHEKRLSYSTCAATVQTKEANLMKMRSHMSSSPQKMYETEMSLRRAQEACRIAQEDFVATSQRVLREVDRFKRLYTQDMRRTVLDYIQLQVEYNRKMEEIWAHVVPQLEQVQLDDNANAIVNNNEGTISNSATVQSTPTTATATMPSTNSMPAVANNIPSMMPSMAQSMMMPTNQPPPPSTMAASVPGLSVQYRDAPSGL